MLVTWIVQRSRVSSLDALRAAAARLADAELPEVLGVSANFHEGEAPQILGSETALLAGVASAPDALGSSTHLATYGSFVQAHRGQAARIHALLAESLGLAAIAREGRGRAPRVLDLYGGSGAIALGLAAAGAEVHLVESFAPAAAHVKQAAEAQKLSVTGECGDVAMSVRAMVERGERFDAAVVNPPRRGMSPMAREWLARIEPAVIAYVSCDPDTLARDLDHFMRLGYATSELRPLDMIPLTDEVETVAILRRAPIPTPRVLFEDDEILVVEKGAHEPTAPQAEYAGSPSRARGGSRAREDAVPVHRIDIGTSGLVLLAKRGDLVAKWQEALGAATTRKIYVAATRGVTPSKGAITRELREDGKMYPARTRYRRLAVASGHSVVRVIPEQGRTHQIRRHLAAIGHPVLGDDRYGHVPTNRFFEEKNGLDRAFLHCVRIEIDHPTTGVRLMVEAPLPGDLRAVLERTSGPGTLRFLDHKNALGTSGGSLSSLPPPPDSMHDRGSVLDVDASSPTIHPASDERRRRPPGTRSEGVLRADRDQRPASSRAEPTGEARLRGPAEAFAGVPAHARFPRPRGARQKPAPPLAVRAVDDPSQPRALEEMAPDARAADVARVAVEAPRAEAKRLRQVVRGNAAEEDRLGDPLPCRRVDPRRLADERQAIEREEGALDEGARAEGLQLHGADVDTSSFERAAERGFDVGARREVRVVDAAAHVRPLGDDRREVPVVAFDSPRAGGHVEVAEAGARAVVVIAGRGLEDVEVPFAGRLAEAEALADRAACAVARGDQVRTKRATRRRDLPPPWRPREIDERLSVVREDAVARGSSPEARVEFAPANDHPKPRRVARRPAPSAGAAERRRRGCRSPRIAT